jgi:hypothetical protein
MARRRRGGHAVRAFGGRMQRDTVGLGQRVVRKYSCTTRAEVVSLGPPTMFLEGGRRARRGCPWPGGASTEQGRVVVAQVLAKGVPVPSSMDGR